MKGKDTFPVEQSVLFQEILKNVLYTRAQNDTIMLNQTVIDDRLMRIIRHLNIDSVKDFDIANSNLLKVSQSTTQDSYESLWNHYVKFFQEGESPSES